MTNCVAPLGIGEATVPEQGPVGASSAGEHPPDTGEDIGSSANKVRGAACAGGRSASVMLHGAV